MERGEERRGGGDVCGRGVLQGAECRGKGIKLPAMRPSGKLKWKPKSESENPETKAISAAAAVVAASHVAAVVVEVAAALVAVVAVSVAAAVVVVAYLFHSISISRSFHAYDFNFG